MFFLRHSKTKMEWNGGKINFKEPTVGTIWKKWIFHLSCCFSSIEKKNIYIYWEVKPEPVAKFGWRMSGGDWPRYASRHLGGRSNRTEARPCLRDLRRSSVSFGHPSRRMSIHRPPCFLCVYVCVCVGARLSDFLFMPTSRIILTFKVQ